MTRIQKIALLFTASAAVATVALAQAYDPMNPGASPPPAPVAAGAVSPKGMTPSAAPTGLREYPVRTPAPANAVENLSNVDPTPGKVQLMPNMPGHRRFRPPFFPNAGWDSPVEAGAKDYARYLEVYWRAPYLAPGPVPNYDGMEIKGWTMPPPWKVNIVRSKATPAEEALFEKRLQLITERVMASAPFANPYGASIEPEIVLDGYGLYGDKKPLMQATITFKVNIIQPHTGKNERIGDAVRSHNPAAFVTVLLNPKSADCGLPWGGTTFSRNCLYEGGIYWNTARSPLRPDPASSSPLERFDKSIYADGKPSTDLRVIDVSYGGGSFASSELDRGRMHPLDPYGRAIGAVRSLDWNAILKEAAAIR